MAELFPLVPEGPGPQAWSQAEGTITADAPPNTDIFLDPGEYHDIPPSDAARLVGTPPGDFQLAARVTVDFRSTYDAGVLVVYADERNWAKLCFEFTPQKSPSVVTVVTRGVSDDANAFEVSENSVWLRISRTGNAYAFHASTDGRWWRMVRYFALAPDAPQPARVGFLAQSPTGPGCRVTFGELKYRPEALADLRDGS